MSTSVAIVDYGVGNLFSIERACLAASLHAVITSDADAIRRADAVVLPGIGAFGDAMAALNRLRLIDTLRAVSADGRPLIGVCLGMQLMMEQSHEFGRFEGLGLLPGTVESIADVVQSAKVPHVGWTEVRRATRISGDPWAGTLLEGLPDGEAMYFVHSYVVRPAEARTTLGVSTYSGLEFSAAIHAGTLTGVQFHPERSGAAGLRVYRNLAAQLAPSRS